MRYATHFAGRDDIPAVQRMEMDIWGPETFPEESGNGLAVTRYDELFELYPHSLLVASPYGGGNLEGYVAVERINSGDIPTGKDRELRHMPPYNHPPEATHRPEGNLWYILHSGWNTEEAGNALYASLRTHAMQERVEGIATVENWDHPGTANRDEQKKALRARNFIPLDGRSNPLNIGDTRDILWGPVAGDECEYRRRTGMTVWLWAPPTREQTIRHILAYLDEQPFPLLVNGKAHSPEEMAESILSGLPLGESIVSTYRPYLIRKGVPPEV